MRSIFLYNRVMPALKGIYRAQRFCYHPINRKKTLKADRQLKTMAGRLVSEPESNLKRRDGYEKIFELYHRVVSQTSLSKNKVYSLHKPDVVCLSKGKEHKKYEFGNKLSILVHGRTYSWHLVF